MKSILLIGIVTMFLLTATMVMADTTCPSGTTPTHVETVTVQSDGSTITSSSTLDNGVTYLLKASGTYRFANWGDYGIADAEWAYRNDAYKDDPLPDHRWTLGENTYPSVLGLDVKVDGANVYWGDYNDAHNYVISYIGNGNPVSFDIHDSHYGDNSGSLTVDIDKCADIKVHGGGHMLQDGLDGMLKRKDWFDISFGGFIADAGAQGLFGEWQINFHNVNTASIDKSTFHTTDITSLNLYVGNTNTCTEAMNFGATGEWNGIPGYRIIFRAGDSSDPSSYDTDTTRVTLYNPSNVVVYDTHWVTEFSDESDCVGTARTKLDTGNIIIQG